MNIKIKLKNPKYCDGCILMNSDIVSGQLCGNWFKCSLYNLSLTKWKYKTKRPDNKCIRPKKCIKENGE